jgi:hypothetical protein
MTNKPSDMANDITGLVLEGTKKWTKIKKTEERNPASRRYRRERMTRAKGISQKDAAAQILPEAYNKVSGGGTLPANARQLMYAARPHIQKVTGHDLTDNYFTQTLLPDYLVETGADWDVVFDARGHFVEPFEGKSFGIGTLEVRAYLKGLRDPSIVEAHVSQAEVETSGPAGNFGAVLFIEKEGFAELLKAAKIADRFDIGIMSTKGMSVVAARALADEMCHAYDIPLLLLRDFDKTGFAISGTLQRDTRRYEFKNQIETIELGLSLDDVTAMRLEAEHQHHRKGAKDVMMANLRENGATEAEIAFMFRDFDRLRSTRRVELNAMTSPQMVAFIEKKLRAHGIKKIVPNKTLLAEVHTKLEKGRRLQEVISKLGDIKMSGFKAPANLESSVRKYLKEHSDVRWDVALEEIVTKSAPRTKKPPPKSKVAKAIEAVLGKSSSGESIRSSNQPKRKRNTARKAYTDAKRSMRATK